ncbi:uncharacterized protein E0L32_012186 [Thyridium curvatum]|uniref:Transcription factor Iwr1 domain-containing protein n=1 Tax=Thyridium curvatum TaxID=1093900 RepID=A0A507BJU4_9PEZI|nr:uncharacterized protein E0L32_012186 [Thyridium curvatum]TPX17331.1 hypothetical protein E0L32_012186 [Thyridium curvatum]
MSVPPQVIHVKRKRTEEGPVAFLRLEENNKRYRSSAGTFLYKRNDPTAVEAPAPAETRDIRPVIHVSKPGDEEERPPVVKTARAASGTDAQQQQQRAHKPIASPRAISTSAAAKRLAGGAATTTTTTGGGGQRRFHLSRSSTPATPPPVLGSGGVNKRSRYASPAVFVERGKRKKATAAGKALEKQVSGLDLRSGGPRSPSPPPPESMDVEQQKGPPARLPKRPGSKMAGSRVASAAAGPPEASGGLPKSLLNRWEVDTDELAREMNEYTLKQIGLNLARIEAEDSKRAASAKPAAATTTTPLSPPRKPSSSYLRGFKPKSPAAKKPLGLSEPEGTETAAAAPRQQTQDVVDVDMAEEGDSPESDEEDDDEEDYVTETYYRVPEQVLDAADINPEHVGLLVFDTEPDVEFFYGNESESEEDWEPDEDENGCGYTTAENYYTADYPDDEVASDDEYDQNAYHYRTGNASDLEEFDDDAFSGDEDNGGFKITIGGKKSSNMY